MKNNKITFLSNIPFYFRIPILVFLAGLVISSILGLLQHHSFNKAWEKNSKTQLIANLHYIDYMTENKDLSETIKIVSGIENLYSNSVISLWNKENKILYHNNDQLQQLIKDQSTNYIKDFETLKIKLSNALKKIEKNKTYYIDVKNSIINTVYSLKNGHYLNLQIATSYKDSIKYIISIYLSLVLLTVLFTLIVYIFIFGVQKDIDEILAIDEESLALNVSATSPETMKNEATKKESLFIEDNSWKQKLNATLFTHQLHKTKHYEILSFPRNPAQEENDFQSTLEINDTLYFLIANGEIKSLEDAYERIRIQERFRLLCLKTNDFSETIQNLQLEIKNKYPFSLSLTSLKIHAEKAEVFHTGPFKILYLYLDENGQKNINEINSTENQKLNKIPVHSNGSFILISQKMLTKINMKSSELQDSILKLPTLDNGKKLLSEILRVIYEKANDLEIKDKPPGMISIIKT